MLFPQLICAQYLREINLFCALKKIKDPTSTHKKWEQLNYSIVVRSQSCHLSLYFF